MSASADAPGGGASSGDTDFEAMWSSDGMTRSFSSATAGLPADLPFLFQAGQRFGPYLIVRPLGKGGMGQVYEAEETESGRRVAIKILSRGLGDDEERERFLSEGRLAASLSHPNSVYIFGTSEVQGLPVIAMELAPGGTLKDLLVDGTPLAPPAAVDAILQVIAGLEAAAALGILHRDIKPSNCFVDRDGRVLVGDFGLSIATLAREPGTSAGTGTIVGTPGFASPEQLRGDPLDVRSDIYSVGATIYYLLTGRPPFDGRARDGADDAHGDGDPGVAGRHSPRRSERARPPVVMRCLTRTPQERFADYRALAAALEPFRSTTQVAAWIVAPVLRERRRHHRVFPGTDAGQHARRAGAGRVGRRLRSRSCRFRQSPSSSGTTASSKGGSARPRERRCSGFGWSDREAAPPGSCAGCYAPRSSACPRTWCRAGSTIAFVERMATPSAGTALDDRDPDGGRFRGLDGVSRPAVLDRAAPQRLRRTPRSGQRDARRASSGAPSSRGTPRPSPRSIRTTWWTS